MINIPLRFSIEMSRFSPCFNQKLEYLECPQYLRKDFFPHHKDLKYAGLLNPLDSPHHLRATEFSQYREGIVLDRPASKQKGTQIITYKQNLLSYVLHLHFSIRKF